MTTETNILKIGLAGILISIFAYSCSKDLPACTGNCDLVSFSGSVADFTNGQPISGQTIKVILKQNYCIICSPLNVASGSSDANGHFEIRKEMDTTWLQDHYMVVQLTTTDGYITQIVTAGSIAGSLFPRTKEFSFSNIDSSLNRILFNIYPKTSLSLNLHRNSAIISGREYFSLQYGFTGSQSTGDAFIMNITNKDTVVLINTAANIFTKIRSSKFITYDSPVDKIDSIKCSPNARNSIDISY